MTTRKLHRWLLLLGAFALIASACGSSDDDADDDSGDTDTAETPTATAAAPATTAAAEEDMDDDMDDDMDEEEPTATTAAPEEDMDDDMDDEMSSTPGEGTTIRMGRANWSTGYFQAEVYKLMLEELGYTVTDPSEIELGPNQAYVAMAQDDFDFWVNSWYPGHNSWLAGELPDGTLVGDHVSAIGAELVAGGLQGFLIEKTFADKYGIKTMDDLNDNPEAIAEYDASDTTPGNGVAEMFGCPESWTCDDITESTIAFNGWDNIAQVKAGYDAMFAQAVSNTADQVPFVIYTWTPSAYITQLLPGNNVYWLGVENVLDDSNPLGLEGGEEWDQGAGSARISADLCPAAADHAEGLCVLGWEAADILVTARNDFMENNPVAKQLFEDVVLSVIDVSLANVSQGDGEDPTDLAAKWIGENRDTVDGWLEAARAAA